MWESFILFFACLVSSLLPPTDSTDNIAKQLGKTANINDDHQIQVRIAALEALAQIGPKATAAVPELKKLLCRVKSENDQTDLLVFHTALALAAMGKNARGAIPALVLAQGKVSDPKAKKALSTAVFALSLAQPPPAAAPPQKDVDVKALIKDLNNQNKEVRKKAADALKQVAKDIASGMTDLINAMKNQDPDVADAAQEFISQLIIQAQSATQAYVILLSNSLNDQKPTNRQKAAEKLGALGKAAANAIPFLQDRKNNPNEKDPNVKKAIEEAITNIKGS